MQPSTRELLNPKPAQLKNRPAAALAGPKTISTKASSQPPLASTRRGIGWRKTRAQAQALADNPNGVSVAARAICRNASLPEADHAHDDQRHAERGDRRGGSDQDCSQYEWVHKLAEIKNSQTCSTHMFRPVDG